jgi:hypothetical protein
VPQAVICATPSAQTAGRSGSEAVSGRGRMPPEGIGNHSGL